MHIPFVSTERSAQLLKRTRGSSSRVTVLTFHGLGSPPSDVLPEERDYFVPESSFERILDSILSWPREVVITFDDGFVSDIEIALPALIARGLKATFFIPIGKLGEAGRLRCEDVSKIHFEGMNIGSHGKFHVPWTTLTGADLDHELQQSRDFLEKLLGSPVVDASCPFGAYNRRVLGAIIRAGYQRAFTSDGGSADRNATVIPRTTVRPEHTTESLAHSIQRDLKPARAVQKHVELAIKRWR